MADPVTTAVATAPDGATKCASSAALAPPADACSRSRTTFWFAFWLAVILVATKAAHLGAPDFEFASLVEFVQDLTVISQADVAFAILVGVVGQIGLQCSTRRPRLARSVWVMLVIFCLVSIVYAVVSARIFSYVQSPLTYRLIYLAGDLKNMRSSVGRFVSGTMVVSVVGAPLAFLAAAGLTNRFVQPRRTRAFRCGQALALVVTVALVAYSRYSRGETWANRNDASIVKNPHWTLVSSLVTEFFSGGTVELSEEFPHEFLADFATVAERPGGGLPALKLEKPPRNVILLVLESTSTQYLNVYGGKYDVAPRLAAEAASAVVFDNCYCHVGLTANAEVAINLSIFPGMTWREYTLEHPRLPGTSLAEVLRARGYRTAFIHNGDLGYVNQRGFLVGRGFDDLWDYRNLACGQPDFNDFSWGVEDRCLVDGILQWIDRDRAAARPFFTLAWTIQAHHPYTLQSAEPIDFFKGDEPPGDAYDLRLYLNALRETDRQVGRLLDGLRERGLADDTLVVITGDHGEAFGHPHDTYGHGGALYQENMNVPLVIWNPRHFGGGRRSAAVGSQIDINPTILDVLGLPSPGSWQGRSLFDPARPQRAFFYAVNNDYFFGVREDNWKYIYNATIGREQLFNLAADPAEQDDVAARHPDRCRQLRQRLAAWLSYEKKHLAKLHAAERSSR